MIRSKPIALFLIIMILFTGCIENENTDIASDAVSEPNTRNIFAMDTTMDLTVYGNSNILDKAEAEIMRIDKMLSKTNKDSEIYRLNESGKTEISDETKELILKAVEISEKTNGVFDITIEPIMSLWGFSNENFRVPATSELADVLKKVNYKNILLNGNNIISLSGNSRIDLGGIAKGFTSDRLTELFKNEGVESAIISLGGNVQAIGKKPDGSRWKIAVQNPFGDAQHPYIGVIEAEDKAVITSGGYQRYFEKDGIIYHHIIDPATGYPASNGLSSVTIVSKSGTLADALSTSIYIMGLEDGISFWKQYDDFDVVFVTDNGEIYITDGISDVFTSDFEYKIVSR